MLLPWERFRARLSRHRRLAGETLLLAVLAGLLFFVVTRFIGQGYVVEGRCMEPRLYTGERVLGDKWTFEARVPRRGDVVIFRHPTAPSRLYIKRIIALGEETVEIRGGIVYVEGKPLREPYLTPSPVGDFPPHKVIADSYFVLGDNRAHSEDSRLWGDVDRRAVVARAWLRYWPLPRCATPF